MASAQGGQFGGRTNWGGAPGAYAFPDNLDDLLDDEDDRLTPLNFFLLIFLVCSTVFVSF